MISLGSPLTIYLATTPVDMRKSFDSLAEIVREYMQRDPLSGSLFVFVNRSRDKIKVLYWSRTGYCLFYKRLERGRFKLPKLQEGASSLQLDHVALEMLLDGIKIEKVQRGKGPWD